MRALVDTDLTFDGRRFQRSREPAFSRHRCRWMAVLALAFLTSLPAAAEWVRAGLNTNQPIWGWRGGLLFALHPGGFTGGDGGPRGLIRIGYPTLPGAKYDLINFIAVEPVVKGRRGYSEMEKSDFDQKAGRRFLAIDSRQSDDSKPRWNPGELSSPEVGVEQLSVTVSVERFANGAHVRLKLIQRNDRPNELRLIADAEPDSAPLDQSILTATMGNKARARLLFLEGGSVSSHQLYPSHRTTQFAPHRLFPLEKLPRAADGDVLVAIANDEEHPETVRPFGQPRFWDYLGAKVTQYWRKPASEVTAALECAVNARYTYYLSEQPIPGGVSFENFEFREPFRAGQTLIFGITPHDPLKISPRQR